MPDHLQVMVIDDDELDRKVIMRLIRESSLQCHVTEAENLAHASEYLKRNHVHCVLLDYQMPGQNGLEVLEDDSLDFENSPVIFMTGMGDERLAVQAIQAGAYDYLPKEGLTTQALENSIKNALKVFDLEQRAKQAERELRERELRYRMIVETVSDLIVQLDENGRILYVNSALEPLGYVREELIGKPFLELVDNPEHTGLLSRSKILTRRQGKRATRNMEISLKMHPRKERESRSDSVTFLLDVFGLWEPPPGDPRASGYPSHFLGSLGIARNISERKRFESQLKAFTNELQRSNQDLQEFAYIASHDLQEPLRKILMFGDRLEKQLVSIPEQARGSLDRMRKAAQRMQTFISELLQLSRVTTRGTPFRPVSLQSLVQEVWSELDHEADDKLEPKDLPEIKADAQQLQQIFQCLLSNALKFRKPGLPCRVQISAEKEPDGFWVLRLCDQGIGFDPQYSERIFRPFERLHGNSEFEGTGMGLAITRKIVERHGGKIWADSAPGQGTTIFIKLPSHSA